MKTIIYCFFFQSFVNLPKKKKKKFTDCSVQTKNAITWATSHWVLTRYTLTSETSTSRFVLSPSEMLYSLYNISHDVLGSLVTGMVQRFFLFCFLGFFFFFLPSCYKIFSSFLKNKLVNKFILFCFYFTQSFIFNPIPAKQNC